MIIALATTTIDGKIAQTVEDKITWHSKKDIKYFVKDTKDAGVVVMGSTTFRQIFERGRTLPGRRKVVMTSRVKELEEKYGALDDIEFTSDSPQTIVDVLKKDHESIALIGGGQIYGLFLECQLIDEIRLTIAPFIFGKTAVNLFEKELTVKPKLKLISSEVLDSDFLRLIYKVSYE